MWQQRLASARMHRAKLGNVGLLKYYFRRLRDGPPIAQGHGGKIDVHGFFAFVRRIPFGPLFDSDTVDARTINWVIPDFGIGSGGHLNIFRLIQMLEANGFDCKVTIVGPTAFSTGRDARACIREHFFAIEAPVTLGESRLEPAMTTVATSWQTAYSVLNFRGTRHKCYFVQDYEPYFYPHGSEYFLAEATYRMGLLGITAGDWLASKLSADFGMITTSMGFSYDRQLYKRLERREPDRRRIFFYARPVTSRRAFELGLLALYRVHERMPSAEFILAGWDTSNYAIPFQHLNAGNVKLSALPDLYNQCDVALVISSTNLSLLPLELMACGCPVVSNSGPNVAWLLNPSNSVLCEATPEALADGLLRVLHDDSFRHHLSNASVSFAQSTDWSCEGAKAAAVFDRLANTA